MSSIARRNCVIVRDTNDYKILRENYLILLCNTLAQLEIEESMKKCVSKERDELKEQLYFNRAPFLLKSV